MKKTSGVSSISQSINKIKTYFTHKFPQSLNKVFRKIQCALIIKYLAFFFCFLFGFQSF